MKITTIAAVAIAVVLAGGPALAQEWTQTDPGVLTLSGTSVRIEAIRKADGNTVFEIYDGDRDLGGQQSLEAAQRFGEIHAKREYHDVPSMGGPAR